MIALRLKRMFAAGLGYPGFLLARFSQVIGSRPVLDA